MRLIYLFEYYVIDGNGNWRLTKNYRLTEYDKRKQLAYLKRKGYKYNRSEKAYILESDPCETVYNYAVVVSTYNI